MPGLTGTALAAGAPAGSTPSNLARATYSIGGPTQTSVSPADSITVQELLGHTFTKVDVANVVVAAGSTSRVLTFELENTGNGTDSYTLTNTVTGGSTFTPLGMDIYLDTNSSGTFDAGDSLYVAGVTLNADSTLRVFVVSDIPAGATAGQYADVLATAISNTTGGPSPLGTVFAGDGDSGTDAIVGPSLGVGSDTSTYEVNIPLQIVKSVSVSDPYGGSKVVSGATVQYTVTVDFLGSGTIYNVSVLDDMPANTTYLPGSLCVNTCIGVSNLTDPADSDIGDFNVTVTNGINVDLGHMNPSSGTKTVRFSVTID